MNDSIGNTIQSERTIFNVDPSVKIYQSYKLSPDATQVQELELLKTVSKDNSITFEYFVFDHQIDNGYLLNSLNSKLFGKVYDLYAYVTNENNEIVYQVTSIPEVDLNYMKVASSSDGYISGALLYLNTYANNTITRYSDTLFSSTNDVGEIQEINYYSGPDYENVKYLISVEGGVDIATNVTNVFIMYKPLTNVSEFKVTYLTTLQTYYIVLSGLSTFEAESKVLSLFKLDGYANIDINTYDLILDLIKETNGSADAYKENTYLVF